MPLGWIDFSKTERSKILSVLDMLTEQATLDELGIAPVRDGFSNLFFPGTSTIQTRAKYFFAVPYALKDLEKDKETNPAKLMISLDALERKCGEKFLENNKDESGVIGKRSLAGGNWVKRTPADIYWAGLRQYGIFQGGNISISEYARAMCTLKNKKTTLKSLGNRKDDADENECDDTGAGDIHSFQFWNMPLYQREWFDSLSMNLSKAEGSFLKEQIIKSCPNSMLAFILKNDIREVIAINSFQELSILIEKFPTDMQDDYRMAFDFSNFVYVTRVLYNIIVSDRKNKIANEIFEDLTPRLKEIAALDLDSILKRLKIFENASLRKYLIQAQFSMNAGDVEGLMECIKKRESSLKGPNRAKTQHPGEFDSNSWFGGDVLDYRFSSARTILNDIFESEVETNA